MPPKRRTKAPKAEEQTKPSAPTEPSPPQSDVSEQNESSVLGQPTEPIMSEDAQSPESFPETDEEMPEETEHTTGDGKQGFAGGYNALKSYQGKYYSAPTRGAPVGTEYHWLIVGHQHVKKIDANTYETSLEGSKYKLAYKSATSNTWSISSVKKQREREIELLEDAKMRVQGLPPVSDKAKVEKQEKGQKSLDAMFGQGKLTGTKRKAEA